MEADILQNLDALGYKGPLLNTETFNSEIELGPKSVQFTGLVAWLAEQIGHFSDVEESIHQTTSADDASSFLLELSAFLKEIGCVNQELMTGNVNQRLSSKQAKLNLLEFLITELMTCKILKAKEPEDTSMEITINESETARNLKNMLLALKFQKPPDNITPEMLFKKILAKIQEIMKTVPPQIMSKSLFIGELSNNQWHKLDELQHNLNEEYKIRRKMLLKRLDVTIASFSWSDRIKSKEDQLNECYYAQRNKLKMDPNVVLADLLASREDLAIIEKTSNAEVRKNTRSQVNRVIIGAVPDRGGRPCEQEPPPPEMPPWQKDRVPGPQSSRGGFGGGGRGGNRGGGTGGYRDHKDVKNNFGQNQNNYHQQSQPQYSSGYGNRGGGHQGGYQGNYQHDHRGNYKGNQRGGYQNDQWGGYQNDYRGGYQSEQGSGYQNDPRGGYQQSSYQNDHRSTYQNSGGGRVQGGWNQGDNRSSNYHRGGYGRDRGQRY